MPCIDDVMLVGLVCVFCVNSTAPTEPHYFVSAYRLKTAAFNLVFSEACLSVMKSSHSYLCCKNWVIFLFKTAP